MSPEGRRGGALDAVGSFAEYVERRSSGQELDFEEWSRRHPELEGELQRLQGHWFGVSAALEKVGFGLSLSDRIDQSFGTTVDPRVQFAPEREDRVPGPDTTGERVHARAGLVSRYRVEERIAGGPHSAVFRVWDESLRRHLAMKLLFGQRGGESADKTAALRRLLEEAETTAQLDHPCIVPVHEVGLDSEGRVYFTMKLVRGRTLAEIFERAARGEEGWSPTRVLGIFVKACEALAFAHAKGVVHRNLKPSNVMVGPFGEVYVMNWGLACGIAPNDLDDVRLREDEGASDAHVVGTLAYMAPEQARGEVAQAGPTSDVYSLGAVLYHLLAGAAPYSSASTARDSQYARLPVRDGPPPALHLVAPHVPAELAAICERAMAREPRRRYSNVRELGDDLSAYLEGRVVRAHRTGALAELRKWITRNRPLAAALAAGILLVVVGLATALTLKGEADRQRAGVLRLSAFQEVEELKQRADGLWPAHPDQVEAFDEWLRDADTLVAGLSPSARDAGHYERLAELERRRADWTEEDRWWSEQLAKLVREIEEFAHGETSLIAGVSADHGWGVVRRREWALEIARRSVEGPEARALWAEAVAAIGADPPYGGLVIAPQLGLLPLGSDPQSGLWEFVHLQTGTAPARGADGRLELTEDSGLVLVLLPGGEYSRGAQSEDSDAPNHDPWAQGNEVPVRTLELSPFFLSKYEMTQAQWLRATGSNPSEFNPEDYGLSLLHPVEQMSRREAVKVLAQLDLTLPSEARWEYAMRGGTSTVWWTGSDKESLIGAVNLGDRSVLRARVSGFMVEPWLDDGHVYHAPVNALLPNPYGFHGVHGNVAEIMLDGYDPDFYANCPARDPVCDPEEFPLRIVRDLSFYRLAHMTRSAGIRYMEATDDSRWFITGLRPARDVRP